MGSSSAKCGGKLKTKSLCKKKFRFTATGLIKFKNSCKRHNMRKRNSRQIRVNRLSDYLSGCDAAVVRKKYMPYS